MEPSDSSRYPKPVGSLALVFLLLLFWDNMIFLEFSFLASMTGRFNSPFLPNWRFDISKDIRELGEVAIEAFFNCIMMRWEWFCSIVVGLWKNEKGRNNILSFLHTECRRNASISDVCIFVRGSISCGYLR